MFNPLKMKSVEKRMLIGGIASSVAYYGNLYALNNVAGYPAELKSRLENHLPQNGDIIGSVAPPVVLYVAKKVVKNTGTKEKLGDMFLGSALFSVPNLAKTISVRTAYQLGVESKPATATARARVPMPMSRYAMRSGPIQAVRPSSGISKYTITA